MTDAFVNSNDIIKYSYISYFVRNVVFHSSSSFILMRLKAFFKFNFVNHLIFRRRFLISFNKDKRYLSFYVNKFVFL